MVVLLNRGVIAVDCSLSDSVYMEMVVKTIVANVMTGTCDDHRHAVYWSESDYVPEVTLRQHVEAHL